MVYSLETLPQELLWPGLVGQLPAVLFTSNLWCVETDKDYERKVYTNLISKTACLGRIRHKPMGFVGPLDRQLLTFAWKITAVRTSLRDLLETVMTSMLLNGDVERDRDDWTALAQK